jgi:hypothetical protein
VWWRQAKKGKEIEKPEKTNYLIERRDRERRGGLVLHAKELKTGARNGTDRVALGYYRIFIFGQAFPCGVPPSLVRSKSLVLRVFGHLVPLLRGHFLSLVMIA